MKKLPAHIERHIRRVAKGVKAKAKREVLSAASNAIIDGLIQQFDALIGALCDHCCLTNYYSGQRKRLIAAMEKLTNNQLENIGGIDIQYDVTGDYDVTDGASEDASLLADTVVLTVYSTGGPDFMLSDIRWDGHLKHSLRGYSTRTNKN